MDRETLSHYGWIVILVLILSVLLALCTPFGSFIADGFKATYESFSFTNNAALSIVDTITGGPAANPALHPSGTVPENGKYTTSDGTTYNPGDKMPEPKEGDTYEVAYHHYIYTFEEDQDGWRVSLNTRVVDKNRTEYGEMYETINNKPITDLWLLFRDCKNMKIAPRIPLGTKQMYQTFLGCKSLTVSPEIPYGVEYMYQCFRDCETLIAPPNLPNTVTNIGNAFGGCLAFVDLSNWEIPSGIKNMNSTFQNCKNLVTAPYIPENVTEMDHVFDYCNSLTGVIVVDANVSGSVQGPFHLMETGKNIVITGKAPGLYYMSGYDCTLYREATFMRRDLNKLTDGDKYCSGDYIYTYSEELDGWQVSVTHHIRNTTNKEYFGEILNSIEGKPIKSMYGTFQSCPNIVEAPVIPNTVISLERTFMGCKKLKEAPILPRDLQTMQYAFYECESITSMPTIPNGVKNMDSAFGGCINLVNITTIPESVERVGFTFSGCTSLTTAPVIPQNVTYMYGTFGNCTSLRGNVVINTSLVDSNSYRDFFRNVNFSIQEIIVSGNVTDSYLDGVGTTGINYCKTCNGTCKNSH